MTGETMDRRDILKYAAALTGSAILAPLTSSMLSAKTLNAAKLASGPAFFTPPQFTMLAQIMDTILPRTDSPSASDVGTHLVLDNMFDKVFNDNYRKQFIKRLTLLNNHLLKQNFLKSSPSQRLKTLKVLEDSSVSNEAKSSAEKDLVAAYTDVKQQTITYYLSTEQIAEKHLNYLPIPGEYTACISVEEVGGKAWAE